LKSETFDSIWLKIIEPEKNELLSKYPKHLYFDDRIKSAIWSKYEEERAKIHTLMSDSEGRIDRHKVASIIAYSIIELKPFNRIITSGESVEANVMLANELFSTKVALSITWSFLMQDLKSKDNKELLNIYSKGFLFPNCDHKDYLSHLVTCLYYANESKSFHVLMLSNILFLIEVYTEKKFLSSIKLVK